MPHILSKVLDETKETTKDDDDFLKEFSRNFYQDILFESRSCDFVKTYLKSAKKGDVTAQYNSAYCYHYGKGIEQNFEKAFEWYEVSANNGHAESQYNLGKFY